jgi:hypothetical protein
MNWKKQITSMQIVRSLDTRGPLAKSGVQIPPYIVGDRGRQSRETAALDPAGLRRAYRLLAGELPVPALRFFNEFIQSRLDE